MKFRLQNKWFIIILWVLSVALVFVVGGGSVKAGDDCDVFACCGFHYPNGHKECLATCWEEAGWYPSCHAGEGVGCSEKTSQYCNWNEKHGSESDCEWQSTPYHGCKNNVTCYRCNCTSEPPCDPGDSVPATACRESSNGTSSCTYYVCSSEHSCSREPKTNTAETASSTPPTCSITLPTNVRFNSIASGVYKASEYDRGDMFRINAFGYSTKACGSIVYANNYNREFPQFVPFEFRSMDCSSRGYSRPRDYNQAIAFKTAGGSQVEAQLDPNNICHVDITSEVKSVGPVEDEFLQQCNHSLSVYYPPTFALTVQLVDRNKESVEQLDGRKAYKLVQDTIVDWVGGIGDDPLQFLKSPDVDTLAQKGICDLLANDRNYEYRVGDANPFWLKVTLWDENGPGDFNIDHQDFYLVNNTSGQEYPVNRGTGDTQNQVLGLYDVGLASSHRAPATDGYRTYTVSGSLAETLRTCIQQGNILCTMRFKVEDVPGSVVRQILQSLHNGDPAYKAVDGLPNRILQNPPVAKKVYLRIYQRSLPDGKYFIRVRTKDREGAKYTEDFHNVSFLVDNTLPQLQVGLSPYDADVLQFNVSVSDNNKLPTDKGPAFFAAYVFVQKRDGTRYFLNIVDPNTMRPTSYKVDGTIFGKTVVQNGQLKNVAPYLRVSSQDGGHTQNIKIYVAGPSGFELGGGDKIFYGVCAYDVAGNIKCTQDDLCSPPPPEPPGGIGNNWIKTSLNNVYSKGGFDGLPDYHQLLSIREYPVAGNNNKVKDLFENYLAPFTSSRATLGNFSMVLNTNGFGDIVWGYEGNFFDSVKPRFGLVKRQIDVDSRRYSYMASLAKQRCGVLDSCKIITIDGAQAQDRGLGAFMDAVEAQSSTYKVIYVNKANISLGGVLKCKNANLIFVENSNITIKGQVVKSRVANNNTLSPFADYTEGCLFVLAEGSGNTIVLDDDPKQSATVMGEKWQKSSADTTDTDFMQLGIIAFGSQEGQVRVKQTPREQYKYNGTYDALIVHGFIYSKGTPVFERDLVFADNTRFPSEWIIFDPSLMQLYEPLLGKYKVQTIKCGVNNHPWCNKR